MNFTQSFKLALKSLKTSKMRAFLTMLGIIIGVGAVIVILSLGNGMTNMMNSQFEKMGSNLIQVMTYGRGTGGTRDVDVEDLYDLGGQIPPVPHRRDPLCLRYLPRCATRRMTMTAPRSTASARRFSRRTPRAPCRARRWRRAASSATSTWSGNQNVCVIGDYLAQTAFRGDALGKTISLSGVPYTVVGVLSKSGDSSEGSADDVIYIPYENAAAYGRRQHGGSQQYVPRHLHQPGHRRRGQGHRGKAAV